MLRAVLPALLLTACASLHPTEHTDLAGWTSPAVRPPDYDGLETTTTLLTMRDGAKLALDVHLPKGLAPGQRIPTIVRETRYWRRIDYRWPFSMFLGDRRYGTTRPFFVTRGYAWVDVDVRGTGASDGIWRSPWSPDEVADGAEVLSWIVAQPWSNGRVGATGVSYDGAAAEMLAVAGHPALKAIAPRFSPFDVYADMGFPGGLQLTWLTSIWSKLNDALDHDDFGRFNGAAGLAARGVAPVPGTSRPTPQMLEARRANLNVDAQGRQVTFRDDVPEGQRSGIDGFSPHTYLAKLRASGVAVFSESGWLDGAGARAAVHRFHNLPGGRLVLGPWDHGGRQNVSPTARSPEAQFSHDAELLRFFDAALTERPVAAPPRAAWFTMVADTWHTGEDFPPPSEPREWFFAAGRALVPEAPADGREAFTLDAAFSTPEQGRWNTLVNLGFKPMQPPEQSALDARRLHYTSAPLGEAMEVTGLPTVTVRLAANAPDTAVFAFLEDVDDAGRVRLVTEGVLRAVHRKTGVENGYQVAGVKRSYARADAEPLTPGEPADLVVELFPVSWRFERGHRVRVALAGADADHFAAVPGGATSWTVEFGASKVTLPVVP